MSKFVETLSASNDKIKQSRAQALSDDDKRSGLIKIDERIYNLWIEYLISEERYEDCKLLKDNKDLFVNN